MKSVLKGTRQTEKAALGAEAKNVHTFNVEGEATKRQIFLEIKAKHKVTPLKIHLLAVPRGGKKAYVFLKKGDKIAE